MSDLISRNEVIEELNKYEKELRKDKTEAIETDDEQVMFAITNQETAICRIRRNILHMPTAYDIDKVVEELELHSFELGTDTLPAHYVRLADAIDIVKQGGVSDDVCEWKLDGVYLHSPHNQPFVTCIADDEDYRYNYCPVCGKKIKAVE